MIFFDALEEGQVMRARVLRMGTGVVESTTVDGGEIERKQKEKTGYPSG